MTQPFTLLAERDVFTHTESFRHLFPHVKNQIYLNHAAVSPLSLNILRATEAYLHDRCEGDIENYTTTLMPLLATLRERVSKFIGCEPRQMAFIPNTSYGLNLLAQGLSLNAGDRILLYEKDFPSNVQPFLNLRSQGVMIDFVKDRNGEILLEDIDAAITSRTKLVSISYVQFISGFRVNLKSLADVCHRKNALLSIDAIQALGAMPIDCKNSGVDFLAAGAHKWGMSPMGNGIMYIADELFARLRPAMVGWLSVKEAWSLLEYEQELRDDVARFELGTYNWIGLLGMNEAFKIFETIGSATLEEKLLCLSDYLIEHLQEHGFEPVFTGGRENRSGITTVKNLPNPDAVFQHLMSKRIACSLRGGCLRIAPHFYNTTAELDTLLAELKASVGR
jgi:cysteine desulfurase / selenocysteine lyase